MAFLQTSELIVGNTCNKPHIVISLAADACHKFTISRVATLGCMVHGLGGT